MKEKILDCLAEFAANKKGGKTVACTTMKEDEDEVTLWVARNEGFQQEDTLVFEKLSNFLSQLSFG